jgi:glycosyltransferase involved in cell wall biosynthesis
MSVYNGELYLKEAIKSILHQTYTDFELLIINDASLDSSVEIINSFNDPHIRLIHNENNMGLTASLNKGINFANGRFIARIDADDLSLPSRIQTQLNYFEMDSSLTLCASRFGIIDENGRIIGHIHPRISDKLIDWHLLSWYLLFGNQIGHLTVTVKKDALIKLGGYAEWAKQAQDYELWTRMSRDYKMIVVPEVLGYWRYHKGAISASHFKDQSKTVLKAMHTAHKQLVGKSVNKNFSAHLHELFYKHSYRIKSCTPNALRLLGQIENCFIEYYNPENSTQAEVKQNIRDVMKKLVCSAILRPAIHSISVFSYILLNYPRAMFTGKT